MGAKGFTKTLMLRRPNGASQNSGVRTFVFYFTSKMRYSPFVLTFLYNTNKLSVCTLAVLIYAFIFIVKSRSKMGMEAALFSSE